MTEKMPDEFDEWFDANYYTFDPIARRTIRATFFAGKELGEKAGRSAQAVIDAKIAAEADTNYDAEEQILAGFRQHQEGQ